MPRYSQSFPEAIYKGLEQGLIVGNGLEYVSVRCHVADGPLAQPCTTQAKDVTEGRVKTRFGLLPLSDHTSKEENKSLMCASKEIQNIFNDIFDTFHKKNKIDNFNFLL